MESTFFDSKKNRMNSSLRAFDRFNQALYEKFSAQPGIDIKTRKMICTHTMLYENKYGDRFYKNYLKRANLTDDTKLEHDVVILRSAVMNPWITETAKGSFLDILEKDIIDVCEEVMVEMNKSKGLKEQAEETGID